MFSARYRLREDELLHLTARDTHTHYLINAPQA
jgi:hypothetical protein